MPERTACGLKKTKARVRGEHRDPGWLFQWGANGGANPASGLGQRLPGSGSLTLDHSPRTCRGRAGSLVEQRS